MSEKKKKVLSDENFDNVNITALDEHIKTSVGSSVSKPYYTMVQINASCTVTVSTKSRKSFARTLLK